MGKGARALTRSEQFLEARNHFSGVRLTHTGMALPLRPTPESPTYQIRIDYAPPASPKVYVLSPPLARPPKHVYRGGHLCLYYRHEWSSDMSFADTIIPWTSEWLYFYELWQVCGKWFAPESPHGDPK